MLGLKNVSIDEVILLKGEDIRKLAKETDSYNAADIYHLVDENPNYNWKEVVRELWKVKTEVEKADKKGKEPTIYLAKEYNDKNLEYVDALNYGDILLLDNPTLELQTKYKFLRRYSIQEIKRNLALTDRYGNNYFLKYARNIGEKSIDGILQSIEMYNDQVERQAKLTEERDCNLFTKDRMIKKEIVEEIYSDIIMYMLYTSPEKTVWGNLSDKQKKLYMSSVINDKKIDRIIKERMTTSIADYTTLPELEKVANGEQKVLKRFFNEK